jgi:uncharacterized protein (TIGR02001 family)
MMKKTLIATAVLAASSTAAMAEISGNVSLVSDYAFRGVSQTDEQIALQGGFDWAHDSGFYIGTWASNVDSSFFNGSRDPQIELDIYAGYAGELANGIGYDVGVLRYEYPGSNWDSSPGEADTTEVYVSGSMAGFTVSFNYTNELAFLESTESAYYLAAGYEMSLPQDFGLALHVGYSDGDAFDNGTGAALADAVLDWSIGITKSVGGVDLGLTYVDSDGDDVQFAGFSPGDDPAFGDLADSRVVFSVSKSM